MRNAIIGIVIGLVIGVVVGATVVAPRLNKADRRALASHMPRGEKSVEVALAPLTKKTGAPSGKMEKDKAPTTEPVSEKTGTETRTDKPEKAPEPGAPVEKPAGLQAATQKSQAKAEPLKPVAPLQPVIPEHDHPTPPAGPRTIHWKMGSAYPSTLPQLGTLAKRLDRDIWRVSDGLLEIKFYEPGALVPPLEMFDAVRAGVIDAAFSSPGFWGNKIPALQLFASIPFGPSAEEYLAWVYFGGGQKLFNEIYNANGIHSILCGLIAPEAAGWFRTRIRTLEDFKGLKMRIFGLGAKVMQKLGVETSTLTSGDIYMALESGEIDAAEFSMPAIDLKLGLHRMVKNYYFPGWHQPSTFLELMINLKKWKALPASGKAQIEAVCGDNIRYALGEGGAAQFEALKMLRTEGVNFRRWPGEILDALKTAWKEVAREEAEKDKNFNRVWQSLSAFRENYAIWRELNAP